MRKASKLYICCAGVHTFSAKILGTCKLKMKNTCCKAEQCCHQVELFWVSRFPHSSAINLLQTLTGIGIHLANHSYSAITRLWWTKINSESVLIFLWINHNKLLASSSTEHLWHERFHLIEDEDFQFNLASCCCNKGHNIASFIFSC